MATLPAVDITAMVTPNVILIKFMKRKWGISTDFARAMKIVLLSDTHGHMDERILRHAEAAMRCGTPVTSATCRSPTN